MSDEHEHVEIPETSLAACLVAQGEPLSVREVRIPTEIEPGAILVRTERATICGTDVHIQHGGMGRPDWSLPVILGHEMTGRVARVGAGVTHDSLGTPLELGDRIVWTPSSCGTCYACTVQGMPTLCSNRRFYMTGSCEEYPYVQGGFSEYCYVYPGSGRIRVPDEVPSALASAASCALRTVVNGFDRLGRIEGHETVVVQGAGPVGLWSTALAVASGAHQVIVLGAPAARLAVARSWGATHTIDIDEVSDPSAREEQVRAWTGGRGADVVVEASGGATAFGEGVGLTMQGGRYAVIGQVSRNEIPFAPALVSLRGLTIVGVMSGHTVHYYKALQFLLHNRDRFPLEDMLSNEYPLDRINDALDAMRAYREVKPVIVFD